MKRRIAKVVVFLLAGAIVNVAVASLFQLPAWNDSGTSETALSQSELNLMWRTHGIGEEYRRTLNGWRFKYLGATVIRAGNEYLVVDGNEGGFNGGGAATFIFIVESGWPLRMLSRSVTDTILPWHSFKRPQTAADRFRWFKECQVLWPGFAINTTLYAAILWVLFAAPGSIRRWRRRRRGLCPSCAYPIGESTVCTECGKQVRTGISLERGVWD